MGERTDACFDNVHPWLYLIYRVAQFALGLTVCGLYGIDLTNAAAQKKQADPRWTFAETVGCLAVFTCLLYFSLFLFERRHGTELYRYHRTRHYPVFPLWDFIISLMYLVVFGLFATAFLGRNAGDDSGIPRMKVAVYIDAANWVLWLLSSTLFACIWWREGGKDRMRLRRWRGSAADDEDDLWSDLGEKRGGGGGGGGYANRDNDGDENDGQYYEGPNGEGGRGGDGYDYGYGDGGRGGDGYGGGGRGGDGYDRDGGADN